MEVRDLSLSSKRRAGGTILYVGIVVVLMALSATNAGAAVGANPKIDSPSYTYTPQISDPPVPYAVGDVFVGVGNGIIKQFNSTGVLKNTLNTTTGCAEDLGMAFDNAGNLYATAAFGSCFGAGTVSKFDNIGNLIGPFGSGYSASTESVVINVAQDVFIGQPDGTKQLLEFYPNGTLINSFSPATANRGTDWNDLAADQCTMYYTSEGTQVKRFNVCTNTQMSDFNTAPLPGPVAYALRILPTGEVIVADSDRVILLNSSGGLEKTYTAPSDLSFGDILFALNTDPDGTHFWTASYSGGKVYKYDFTNTTGPIFEFDPVKFGYAVSGLAIFGEKTVAGGSFTVTKDFRFTDVNFTAVPAQLSTLLPMNGSKFNVSYVLQPKTGTVASTNPGQLYGVVTVNGTGVQNITVADAFDTQFVVNPAHLDGGVDVLRVNTTAGVATIITDTQVTASTVSATGPVNLTINLTTPLASDETAMIYIKYMTSLKGLPPDYSDFVNTAVVTTNLDGLKTATATINFVKHA